MSQLIRCLGAAVVLLSAWPAFAQAPPAAPPVPAQPLNCADFKQNPNGSWTLLHPVTVNGATVGAGSTLSVGAQINGVDVAAQLNKTCQKH